MNNNRITPLCKRPEKLMAELRPDRRLKIRAARRRPGEPPEIEMHCTLLTSSKRVTIECI